MRPETWWPGATSSVPTAQLRQATASVDGWLRGDEATFLYLAARDGPGAGAIVELGSWKGKSTIWLAAGSLAAGREKVYAIDPHTGSREHGPGVWTYPDFERNIRAAGLADQVVPVVKPSLAAAAAWSGPVRLLWIDGAHEEDAVRRDVEAWTPFLVEEGIVALHDTIGYFTGPKRVSADMLRTGPFRGAGIVGITTYAQRASTVSSADRMANRLVLFRRTLLELAGRR